MSKPIFSFVKIALLLLATSQVALAQEHAQDSSPKLVTTKVSESFYILSSPEPSGAQHMGLSIGEDGLVLIDSLEKHYQQQTLAAIRQLSDKAFVYGINVLIHKTGTNGLLRREGAKIVRARDEYPTWVDPEEADATISFSGDMELQLNGDILKLSRERNHTLGDAIVEARNNNVVFTGWAYVSERLPQPRNFHRQLEVLQRLLDLSDDNTLFVPASGKIAKRNELQGYRDSLVKLQETVLSLMDEGQDIEAIAKAPSVEAIAGQLSILWDGPQERFHRVERDVLRGLVTTIVLAGKRDRPLLVDNETLQAYAGSYRTPAGETFDLIALDGMLLHGRMTDQYATTELIPITPAEFFVPYTGTKFLFALTPEHSFKGLVLDRQGTKVNAAKL